MLFLAVPTYIDVVHEMTTILEDRRAACIVTGIDYRKVFNRLAHQPCLEAFRDKGVSQDLIQLLASFMSKRTMTVRAGNANSTPRNINATSWPGDLSDSGLS